MTQLYLASRSPRRRALLQTIGLQVEPLLLRLGGSRPADIDETPLPGESAEVYVERITYAKAEFARQVLRQRGGFPRPILTADTTVSLQGRIFGKPDSGEQAVQMLSALSGRAHDVLTCVAVVHLDRIEHIVQSSRVYFRPLSPDEIQRYVASGEPADKAGSYAIQGQAAIFISHLEGSYSGVMGLPLFETAQLLGRVGIALP